MNGAAILLTLTPLSVAKHLCHKLCDSLEARPGVSSCDYAQLGSVISGTALKASTTLKIDTLLKHLLLGLSRIRINIGRF